MKNEFVKYARVLDTKEGQVSPISIMRLLEENINRRFKNNQK